MIVVKRIIIYEAPNGKEPLVSWINSLDWSIRLRVKKRIERLKSGNLGDFKCINDGLYELRMHFGAGYRIYVRIEEGGTIHLLCGGCKSRQQRDIELAKKFIKDLRGNFHES